jgi:hypothetical protein
MYLTRHLLLVCLPVALVALLAGCSRRPHNGHGGSWLNPEPIGRAAMEELDTNKDGKIDRLELEKCPGLKAAVDKIDPRGTGEITAKMIAARIKSWKDSRLGRMAIRCRITRIGKPLGGARVRFVPERFLGFDPAKWTASGTTDDNGIALMSVLLPVPADRRDLPGVAPGFYRVEITKPGVKIPAKYNTETTLGQEVALDARGIKEGIRFDLDF